MSFTTWPLWLSILLFLVLPTALAMVGPFLVRRYVSLQELSVNNEVAGFKFATVGVIYAVLLAFAVIVVWEKYSDAESDLAHEAGAAATLYRLSHGIGGEPGAALRKGMSAYLESVITDDWSAMRDGRGSPAATRALGALYSILLTYRPNDPHGAAMLQEALRQLDQASETRRTRLVKSSGTVPGIVWFVLFGGAVITVGFTFFFGIENLRAQTLMTGALAMLISSALLVIIAIDRPFAGAAMIEPEALALVLEDLGRGESATR